jgi:hypothetical protein
VLTPSAIYNRTPLARSDDPIAAAEEDIRRYLFAHHIVLVARTNRAKGNPLLVLLGIYALLAVIIALGALWLNRVECDPLIMDRGLTAACRDWSRAVDASANASTRWSPPGSF